MEFEDQEENEAVEMELGSSFDSVLPNSNSGRVITKMPTSPVDMSAEPTSQRKPRYRECLKNHAVTIGGHAVDGCGEFLPAGADGTLDALKCAACNCHRNFHRKEALPGGIINPHDPFHFHHHQHHHYQQQPPPPPMLTYRTPSGYLHVSPQPAQQRPLALPSSSGGGAKEEMEDFSNMMNNGSGGNNGGGLSSSGSRKRFRTKFTAEQKEKMFELAEKLGWRIQKQDEEVIQEFCNEFGIRRHVLKVWMHNNKHSLGKKP
ncbi:OLC1v1011254C1 [Oldenlandia corymbosa var. corymbosa]|uniref:OLC1v1011254C1 n=1 Tax=Oldenlandia corymbosa var. corymbosa TaxID=529605 RepID=A0AAV1DW88_OLDCO|nr:OLC1v1011254C1 [Oldenlandia corymbosa var. corymbosa]